MRRFPVRLAYSAHGALGARTSCVVPPRLHWRWSSRALACTAHNANDDVAAFAAIVGSANVLTTADDTAAYNTDWLAQHTGRSRCVVRPASTAEVAAVLKHCYKRRLRVVPQGGNTGLVGGATPLHDEVVLNMSRMNSIISLDASSGVVVVEAGVILQRLDEALTERGWTVPLDLASRGSCTIGGNIATHAGGVRYMRYGSLRGTVLGLQVVRADGTVLDMLSTLRKDNVGWDCKQLFIGSEGTLGVVTAVAVQGVPLLPARNVALFAVDSFAAALRVHSEARKACGETLCAVELLDSSAMALTLGRPIGGSDTIQTAAAPAAVPGFLKPGSHLSPFYVLIETRGSNTAHDSEKLGALLEGVSICGAAVDGAVAADERQATAIWSLREGVTSALSRRGHGFKYDLCFAPARMLDIVVAAQERVAPWADDGVVALAYGHMADGNVHLNVSSRWAKNASSGSDARGIAAVERALEPWVFEATINAGGSISAEHGLGQAKAEWLERARPASVVALHRDLKRLLDEHGILNPGKHGSPLSLPLSRDQQHKGNEASNGSDSLLGTPHDSIAFLVAIEHSTTPVSEGMTGDLGAYPRAATLPASLNSELHC